MQPETRPARRSRGALLLTIGLLSAALLVTAVPHVSAASQTNARGLSALLSSHSLTDVTRGIAVFPAVPTASQANALNNLGLTVQPMRKVRLALVTGKVSAMQRAVTSGVALDVYPDRSIELLDTGHKRDGRRSLRAAGWTGKGVTVGVVDSGCDATHPDLADQVVHNVTLASAEYANIHPNGDNTVIVAQDDRPVQQHGRRWRPRHARRRDRRRRRSTAD